MSKLERAGAVRNKVIDIYYAYGAYAPWEVYMIDDNGLGGSMWGSNSAAALAWMMFEQSGDIGHYMLYSKLKTDDR